MQLYYTFIVIKMACYWHAKKNITMRNNKDSRNRPMNI